MGHFVFKNRVVKISRGAIPNSKGGRLILEPPNSTPIGTPSGCARPLSRAYEVWRQMRTAWCRWKRFGSSCSDWEVSRRGMCQGSQRVVAQKKIPDL